MNKELVDGTVPSNKELLDGTVPSNKALEDGIVPSNSTIVHSLKNARQLQSTFKKFVFLETLISCSLLKFMEDYE